MKAANPFAQAPATPEPIIAQIRRQLERDGVAVSGGALDGVVDRAVRELWESRVKTFVPVLALRQAREVLREQGMVVVAQGDDTSGKRTTASGGRGGFDALALDRDAMRVDDEALTL